MTRAGGRSSWRGGSGGKRAARTGPRLEQISLEYASVRRAVAWVLRDVAFNLRAGARTGCCSARATVQARRCSWPAAWEIWPTPTGRERRRYLVDGEWQDQPLMARGHIAYLGPEQQDCYERRGWNATVAETVATGLVRHRDSARCVDCRTSTIGTTSARAGRARGRAQRHFPSLSQGQRRWVLLARALVSSPMRTCPLDSGPDGLDAGCAMPALVQLRRLGRAGTAWALSTHRAPGPTARVDARRPAGARKVALGGSAATRAQRRSQGSGAQCDPRRGRQA